MAGRKVLLIHGYSDEGASFRTWAAKLHSRGIDAERISICNYISLNNEVTVPDIAEGLGRAAENLGWEPHQEFDAIVHSTGMLVIRAWLANSSNRRQYLKHLVGLAPATWGSPLAHLGRSWMGSVMRGNRQFGPDFLNAGNRVLDALELGSKFTWDLSHRDLLGESPLFTKDSQTPYAAVFIGNRAYPGIRELINKPGSDGTVRWSGCSLNTRKITVDLRRADAPETRAEMQSWPEKRLSVPMFAVEGKNHASLLTEPEDDLVDRVTEFLKVSSENEFNQWLQRTHAWGAPALETMKRDKSGKRADGWQQFVIHVVDEYGESVPDYVVDLFSKNPIGLEGADLIAAEIQDFDQDVHSYQADPSFRCFHVCLPQGITNGGGGELWLRLTASSGTELIAYQGYTPGSKVTEESPVVLDISHLGVGTDSIFSPFSTTLVEIILNREPLPFQGQTRLMQVNPFTPDS